METGFTACGTGDIVISWRPKPTLWNAWMFLKSDPPTKHNGFPGNPVEPWRFNKWKPWKN
jgi:hypothetical protein